MICLEGDLYDIQFPVLRVVDANVELVETSSLQQEIIVNCKKYELSYIAVE